MKNIYIIISQTGTILSNLLRIVTGKEYNHASFSIYDDLNEMYSFGRKYAYNPFVGVFVVERIDHGTFKRFKNTRCKVISISVTEEQYELIYEKLCDMLIHKDYYKYNVVGLLLAAIHVNWDCPNKFYCSQFVRYILESANVDVSDIPNIVHPTDFLSLDGSIVYEGLLRGYQKKLSN